jgi:glycosyltransferase involved in cell wall biosynthesis
VHLIADLSIGGAQMVLLNLLRESANFRHAVISLRSAGVLSEAFAASGIAVHALNLPWNVAAPARLPMLVRSLRPALLQGWMVHGNLAALWASRASGLNLPTAWGIHQSIIDLGMERRTTQHLLRLSARLSSRATRIVYCSQSSRADHERLGYAPDKGVFIPNGFDSTVFAPSPRVRVAVRERLGVPDEAVLVGTVARVHPQKGHATLFAAAAQVVATAGHDVRFLLVGDGTAPQDMAWKALAPDPAVRARLIPMGRRDDVPELMQAMDVLVNPSNTEALPNVLGEAMATGVPCIATDVGDCAWMIGDRDLIVPPNDPDALAAALSRLVAMPRAERSRVGDRGRQRITDELGIERMVSSYERLYGELVADPRMGE